MQTHPLSIAIAVLVQFVLGALWYSPLLFGKWWMIIMEATKLSKEELQNMQKQMGPFYGLQLVMTVIFTMVLATMIRSLSTSGFSPYHVAGLVWIGFIVPTQIAGVIWGNTKKQFWAKQIFVMTTYQLVGIMLATLILSM